MPHLRNAFQECLPVCAQHTTVRIFRPPALRHRRSLPCCFASARATIPCAPNKGRSAPGLPLRARRFPVAARGGAEVDEGDAEPLRDLEALLVAVELTVVDCADAGVRDQLEACPARAGGGVDLGGGGADTD